MISYGLYKVIHILGLILLFSGLGGVLLAYATGTPKGSAKLAQNGQYKEARQNMIMNQKLLKRNINTNQQTSYNTFVFQAAQLDKYILNYYFIILLFDYC